MYMLDRESSGFDYGFRLLGWDVGYPTEYSMGNHMGYPMGYPLGNPVGNPMGSPMGYPPEGSTSPYFELASPPSPQLHQNAKNTILVLY